MLRAIAVVAAVCVIASAADARPRHHHKRHHHAKVVKTASVTPWAAYWQRQASLRGQRTARVSHARHRGAGPRPRRWCGWWMMKRKGETDRRYWRAAEWRHWGRPAHAKVSGVVVVYPHHVAEIVGTCEGRMCPMISGNDGNAVRTRTRSIRGAIAFRVAG